MKTTRHASLKVANANTASVYKSASPLVLGRVQWLVL